MSSSLSLNNTQIQGHIYSLGKLSHQEVKSLHAKGKNDGLDQIYFKSEQEVYFIEGDGLNINHLNSGVLPEARLKIDGEVFEAKISFIDNERNTASEGAGSMIRGAIGLLSSSLVGGTATSVYGTHLIQQGSSTLQQGTKVISGSFASLGKSLDVAKGMLVDMDPKTNDMARELTNMFRKKAGKPPLPKPQPKPFVSIRGNIIETNINQAVKGNQVVSNGVRSISKGAQLFKTGLYVAGIGAAIAGATLAGGAIYSANRPENLDALSDFRKKPLN